MKKTIVLFALFTLVINYVGFEILHQLAPHDETVTIPLQVEPEAHETSLPYEQEDLHCMAINIYHEARNQSIEGMKAVGFITMNRVNHANYPGSVCEVVYQPYQFSWTLNETHEVNYNNPIERKAWERSVNIAKGILDEDYQNHMHGVTHYHSNKVAPAWKAHYKRSHVIGDHVFYTDT